MTGKGWGDKVHLILAIDDPGATNSTFPTLAANSQLELSV